MYAIWRACERFGILPPNISSNWNTLAVEEQSDMIAYSQIREIEEAGKL